MSPEPTPVAPKEGTARVSHGPARGYRWPDAEPGNTLAVRHGAQSPRLVSERAAALLAEMSEQWPWLEECDAVLLDVLTKAKARYDMLDAYATGVIEGTVEAYPRTGYPQTGIEAVPDRVWQSLQRQENIIIQATAKLGFTATDRAQLFKDAGMARHFGGGSLNSFAAEGRKIRQLRGRGA